MDKNISGFRRGVCGVFVSAEGKVLLGERLKDRGQWQLPQGGVEEGETLLQALCREMMEEVGVAVGVGALKIRRQTAGFIPYVWPPGFFPHARFSGQEHVYFLIEAGKLEASGLGASEEFFRFEWFSVDEVLREVVAWKKDAYLAAFRELGLL